MAIKYIKLIDKKDTIEDSSWIECRTARRFTKGCINLNALNSRGRKRCFVCGKNEGSWCEYFEHGRRKYDYLCQNCAKNVERV